MCHDVCCEFCDLCRGSNHEFSDSPLICSVSHEISVIAHDLFFCVLCDIINFMVAV